MIPAHKPSLSIIIPVLNESENLRPCLSALASASASIDPPNDHWEIILCDGGSTDNTIKIASESPFQLISSAPGRAIQMNAAARCATGETLLFLHADTQLPPNANDSIITAISGGASMGCFERRFDSSSKLLTMTSRLATWRVRRTFLAYGDQAIFIRRDLFEQLGGYRPIKRFEDLDLARRAKRHGRWAILPGPILTDARRFGRHPLPHIIRDAFLTLAWLMGIIDQ